MAPPPSANLPLTQRLMHLAQTLQFGWFMGHLTLLFCTLRYGLSYITFNYYSRWARYSYRTAFIAAAATYGIVVYKAYMARARTGQKQSPLALIGDENVQYMLMALVWLFFYQVPLALLPFAVYSVFHVATYTRANLIPTITPPQPGASASATGGKPVAPKASPLADTIGRFVKKYYDTSMLLVASLEIGLWFRVLLSGLSFARGSWILLIAYSAFVRARYSQSSFVQGVVRKVGDSGDAVVANQSVPPVARQAWFTVKGLTKQLGDVTDLSRYMGKQPIKKAQ
ncbi:hypothetical protein MMC25_007600 [Agyrium rufum]|nr:hypothetical protein [Agyrium rufum]